MKKIPLYQIRIKHGGITAARVDFLLADSLEQIGRFYDGQIRPKGVSHLEIRSLNEHSTNSNEDNGVVYDIREDTE